MPSPDVTCHTVAQLFGVSERTVRNMCREQALAGAYKAGVHEKSHWRIPREVIEKLKTPPSTQTK